MRKRKYSAELIISIVKERIEKETSWECLSAKYNIHHMRKDALSLLREKTLKPEQRIKRRRIRSWNLIFNWRQWMMPDF